MILIRHGQSHFNAHFAKTRVDPGIVDPQLTDEGKRQAEAAAKHLRDDDIERVIVSPYYRTLETAEILTETLSLPVTVEPLVRERAFFTCDIGSPRSSLIERWPSFDFADLEELWWPKLDETEAQVSHRCESFRRAMAAIEDWHRVLVVTHWGFIRGLTGKEVDNADILRFDPTQATQ